jgi:hypothetical protein
MSNASLIVSSFFIVSLISFLGDSCISESLCFEDNFQKKIISFKFMFSLLRYFVNSLLRMTRFFSNSIRCNLMLLQKLKVF